MVLAYLEFLGWQDSNLRMAVPKTAALPLGDTPIVKVNYHTKTPNIFAIEKHQKKLLFHAILGKS